jgi:hypothetical protein
MRFLPVSPLLGTQNNLKGYSGLRRRLFSKESCFLSIRFSARSLMSERIALIESASISRVSQDMSWSYIVIRTR